MTPEQEAPFCVQLEPTEGCNLACTFCGIHGIRQPGRDWRTFHFMEPATVLRTVAAAEQAGWNPRWEIAMHGEPTLNPQLPELVRTIREIQRKAYILLTTNGLPLTENKATHAERVAACRDRLEELFEAGVNTVAVDDYEYVKGKASAAIMEATTYLEGHGVAQYEYPHDGAVGNPHKRHRGRMVTIVQDITAASSGTHSHLANHAGSAMPPDVTDRRAHMACAKPFREISVRWDGSVAICCNDWRGEYVIGNVNEKPISQLWQHPAFGAARRRLLRGQRDMRPCLGCTHTSDRPGLLPDKMGKLRATYPLPQPGDDDIVAEALSQGPLTAPVRREWEQAQPGERRNPLPVFQWRS